MKVRFEKEDKKYFTMAEAPIVNALIKDMKESETIENVVKYAMHALEEYSNCEIFKSSAKVSHNNRIWNYYNDESGTIDIWIDATIEADDTFYIIGFYLSDAWGVTCDSQNHKEIASHMYVRKFTEIV